VALPMDIAWKSAIWADSPGWTPPADGFSISAPAELGSAGGTWVLTGSPKWLSDVYGTGKPAFDFPADTDYVTRAAPTWTSTSVLTAVIVGRVNSVAGGDLIDGSSGTGGRRLLDCTTAGVWRMYAGASLNGGTADTELHLFIAEFNSATNETMTLDGVGSISGNAGSDTNSGLRVGSSANGEHSGSEIAFVGFIDRVLTSTERADLLAWYESEYLGVVPWELNTSPNLTSIDLSWDPVVGAVSYKVYNATTDALLHTTSSTSWSHTGLTQGSLHSYYVTSVNGSAVESAPTPDATERACLLVTSSQVSIYTTDDPNAGSGALTEHGLAFLPGGTPGDPTLGYHGNARTSPNTFYWFEREAAPRTPVYPYLGPWMDGATIEYVGGDDCRIIEWHRGDNAWRQTDLTTGGQQHTIDLSDTTTNAGSGSVTGPFDNVLIEHASTADSWTLRIWDYYPPMTVTKTVPSAWNIRSEVTKAVPSAWNIRSEVTKAVSSAWNIRAEVTKTVSSAWNIRSEVTKTVSSAWNIRSEVTKTVSSAWNILPESGPVYVTATVSSAWNIRAEVTKAVSSAWNIRAQVTKAVSSAWNIRAQVTKIVESRWNILGEAPPSTGIFVKAESGLVEVEASYIKTASGPVPGVPVV
jgi:hypothetical protein